MKNPSLLPAISDLRSIFFVISLRAFVVNWEAWLQPGLTHLEESYTDPSDERIVSKIGYIHNKLILELELGRY